MLNRAKELTEEAKSAAEPERTNLLDRAARLTQQAKKIAETANQLAS